MQKEASHFLHFTTLVSQKSILPVMQHCTEHRKTPLTDSSGSMICALTLARCLLWMLLLLSHAPSAKARPVDQNESNAGKWRRLVSGVEMATATIRSLADPSRIPKEDETYLQVQFAGLGRTGTTSLASAMTILGYRVLHDDEAAAVVDLYAANMDGSLTSDELHHQIGLRGFNCSFLWHDYEWAAHKDNVKVVLNGREDLEKWVDSWLVVAGFYDYLASRPFRWLPSVQQLLPQLHITMKDVPTNWQPEKYLDRQTLLEGYKIHYDKVRATIPHERLLEYNVKQGWEPLCEFLGVPVPDVAFPHVNDRFKIQVVMWSLWLITWIWPFLLAIPAFLLFKLTKYLGRDLAPFS